MSSDTPPRKKNSSRFMMVIIESCVLKIFCCKKSTGLTTLYELLNWFLNDLCLDLIGVSFSPYSTLFCSLEKKGGNKDDEMVFF